MVHIRAAIAATPDKLWVLAVVVTGAVAAGAALWAPAHSLAVTVLAAAVALVIGALWRIEVGVLALLLTMPLDVYGRLATQPITVTLFHVALLLCLASWGLRVLVGRREWLRFSYVDLGLGVLLGAALWSLPFSMSPPATVLAIVRLLFLYLFALMIANVVRDSQQARRLLIMLTVTGVGAGLLALAQAYVPGFEYGAIHTQFSPGGAVLRRPGAFFEDPNYLAGFMTVVLVIALAMLVHSRGPGEALLWSGALVISGAALVVTYSRTGWVGAALGAVVILLTAPRERRAALIGAGVAVVLAATLVAPDRVMSRVISIGDVDRDRSVATRYHMAFSTVDMVRERPVFGTGLGAFDRLYPVYRYPGSHPHIVKPHQLPLALWAEMGIAGLAAQVVLAVSIVAVYVRRRQGPWTALEGAVLAGTIALLVQSLFQYYLYFSYLWLVIALGVVVNRVAAHEEERVWTKEAS